jgi:hypothetical protein
MNLTHSSKIIKTAHAYVQELDREAVLLNIENNQYYRLNEDSLHMFSTLTASASLGEAHALLTKEYDVSGEELWQDLLEFIGDLHRSGLVRVVDE